MRWVFSIGTGAAIGIAAALALELSFRLMRGPATAAATAPASPRVPLVARPWPVRIAIVLFADRLLYDRRLSASTAAARHARHRRE